MNELNVAGTLKKLLLPVIALAVLCPALWAGTADAVGTGDQSPGQAVEDASAPADDTGIRIKSLRLSAGGYMLDLRYEVTDPDKAKTVLTRDALPYLVHDESGKVLVVPNMAKVGRLQQTGGHYEPGKVYFMMFDSGGKGLVKPGDTVTLVVNGAFFEGLTVR